jgi:hypothetical protein
MHDICVVGLLGVPELEALLKTLRSDVHYAGALLVRQLKRREALISRREKQNDVITAFLQALSEKRSKYQFMFPTHKTIQHTHLRRCIRFWIQNADRYSGVSL